jgi:hypothetical protein
MHRRQRHFGMLTGAPGLLIQQDNVAVASKDCIFLVEAVHASAHWGQPGAWQSYWPGFGLPLAMHCMMQCRTACFTSVSI